MKIFFSLLIMSISSWANAETVTINTNVGFLYCPQSSLCQTDLGLPHFVEVDVLNGHGKANFTVTEKGFQYTIYAEVMKAVIHNYAIRFSYETKHDGIAEGLKYFGTVGVDSLDEVVRVGWNGVPTQNAHGETMSPLLTLDLGK